MDGTHLMNLLPMKRYLELERNKKISKAKQNLGVIIPLEILSVKVKGEEAYKNGALGIDWKAGEIREISKVLYDKLMKDDPRNWRIIG